MIRNLSKQVATLSARQHQRWQRRQLLALATASAGKTTQRSCFSTTTNAATSAAPTDRLLVVGSGVAGSASALIAAETYNIPVTLLFAGSMPDDCNSNWAQGGIIYRNHDPESGDSADSLARDIHRAGAGLCQDDAVRKVSHEGPQRVEQLLLQGTPFANVPFDRTAKGDLSLCLEASHAAPRILHYADQTGRLITQHITKAAVQHPLITVQPNTVVTDLVVDNNNNNNSDVCIGVHTLDGTTGRQDMELASRGVVLASGGLGGIYEHSTNPAGFNALGSSVALATRRNVRLQDLEYVQFHPTSLFIPNEARFLLTEALRGEGAILRDAKGRAFAKDFHSDGELAPRDIVARGVFDELQKTEGQHNVFLDITHRDTDWLHERFPTIQAHLSQRGLDLGQDRLPITPAAHYTCGGIATDLHGKTTLKGLYAAGEAARTGLHGGNRLASTSLLEGLVFGSSVADHVGSDEGMHANYEAQQCVDRWAGQQQQEQRQQQRRPSAQHVESVSRRANELLRQVRRIMWDHVGVVRTSSGLATASEALEDILNETNDLHARCPTMETSGVRDAVSAGYAVTQACQANPNSAGAHYILPDSAEEDTDDDEAIAAAR